LGGGACAFREGKRVPLGKGKGGDTSRSKKTKPILLEERGGGRIPIEEKGLYFLIDKKEEGRTEKKRLPDINLLRKGKSPLPLHQVSAKPLPW